MKKLPTNLNPDGQKGVEKIGHRAFVGGSGDNWEKIGRLQFNFLVKQGLKPDSRLVDIACGSLRLGLLAIPYLNTEHYCGIDKEQSLLDRGIAHELPSPIAQLKKPCLIADSNFEFSRFNVFFDFAMANSIFSHLTPADIKKCLTRLRPWMASDGALFATFFESNEDIIYEASHSHANFYYRTETIQEFALECGYSFKRIGDWGHPKSQIMFKFTPC